MNVSGHKDPKNLKHYDPSPTLSVKIAMASHICAARPAAQLSAQPSTQLSDQPLAQPSAQSLARPSAQQTAQPAAQISAQPSAQSLARPSAQQTAQPAAQPALARPSAQQTAQPAAQSSAQPLAQPSAQSLARPSAQQTAQPAAQPAAQRAAQQAANPGCGPLFRGDDSRFRFPISPGRAQKRPSAKQTAQRAAQIAANPRCGPLFRGDDSRFPISPGRAQKRPNLEQTQVSAKRRNMDLQNADQDQDLPNVDQDLPNVDQDLPNVDQVHVEDVEDDDEAVDFFTGNNGVHHEVPANLDQNALQVFVNNAVQVVTPQEGPNYQVITRDVGSLEVAPQPIAQRVQFSSDNIMQHLARQQQFMAGNQNVIQKFNESQNDLIKHLFNGN
jgi:hypothetical protein